MGSSPLLAVESVGVRARARDVLRDVSLTVAAGELLAVIGPNGAGKSSLIHTIIGDRRLASGRVTLAGRALDTWPDRARARRLALLPQSSALDFPFTVHEVVALGRAPHATGARADADIVAEACAATAIAHLATRRYTRLSGGEKQRVQLARVLAQIWRGQDAGDRVLLLDEPVAALDLGHQQWIMQRVARFAAAGVAVVMVLHDISLAARYASRILALRDGRPVALGVPETVVTAAVIDALFDIRSRIVAHPDTGTPVVLQR